MPEDIFRVVITVAVSLACIAFVVQAAIALALYKSVRKIQERSDHLIDRFEPLLAKVDPVVERIGPMIDKAVPVVERIGPMLENASATMERLKPVLDRSVTVVNRVGDLVERAEPAVDSLKLAASNVNRAIVDARPYITEISQEAVGAVRSGREQVERVGELLTDATSRARARLEQIDESLEHTVGQVGNVGNSVKRAVLRPVREANGFAAGLSAAVSSLVHPRKSSPGTVTQDEEMFI